MDFSKAVEGAEKATVLQLFRAPPRMSRLGPGAWSWRIFGDHFCLLSARVTVTVISSYSGLLFTRKVAGPVRQAVLSPFHRGENRD